MTDVVSSRSWDDAADVDVAVVVATHDRAGFLAELLAALEAQTLPATAYDVVVVDDGSTDATWPALVDLVGASGRRLHAVRLAANSGPASARNIGVTHTRAPVVAFTDDDCLPTPGWLAALLAATREAHVAQGRTDPDAAPAQPVGAWDRSLAVGRITWLFETCNIAYRRGDFDAAGGFAEVPGVDRRAVGGHFGEDAMLGHRVVDAGGRVAFAGDATVTHRWLPSTYAEHLAAKRRLVAFPALARHAPTVRRGMWRSPLLTRRTGAADVALCGVVTAAATVSAWPLVLLAPWVVTAWPQAHAKPGVTPWRLAQLAVGDAVGAAALLAGSARHRSVVL